MPVTRDRIVGMFRGIVIGDALGACAEGFSAQKTAKVFGRITEYKPLDGHKWFDGHPIGTYTDDTALSLAVAEGIIESGKVDFNTIAKHHVAYLEHPLGMGGTTKDAIKKMAKGVHWSDSGKTDKPKRGTGNGVCMKVGPLAAWCAATGDDLNQYLMPFACMTHATSIGYTSGAIMAWAMVYALKAEEWDRLKFIQVVQEAAKFSDRICDISVPDDPIGPKIMVNEDRLTNRMKLLGSPELDDPEVIINTFGKGSCYAYDSLPFTLAFFLRDPTTIETLYDVASAGGDVDSNASMLASLQGAMFGKDFFPEHLVKDLPSLPQVDEVANRFCDAAGVE